MQTEPIEDNAELIKIYKADQADRQTSNIDWLKVSKKDSLRRVRVHQLLNSNKIVTSKDFMNAAMIFQHGNDSTDYGLAVKLMKRSIELDSTANRWLLAAATDRYLLSKGRPQIYGTQYRRMGDGSLMLQEMDTTKVSDAERIEYGVGTLAEQRERIKRMNQKQLAELFDSGKTIDEIIELIRDEDKTNPKYDISEIGINSFGYYLMNQGKNQEALKIFKLNTELYPSGFNTYDSYGECLLKMGDMENAIRAYEKSLELNPDNDNAKKILKEIE